MRKERHFGKIALFVLLAAVVLIKITRPVLAAEGETAEYYNTGTGYRAVIEDEARLLTDYEKEKLLGQMAAITEYGNVAFVSVSKNTDSSSKYAKNYYEAKFGHTNGTVFLIDMDNRYIWIYSSEAVYNVITDSYADTITDNVYRLASAGRYYDCAADAFDQIYRLLNGQHISQPMKYVSNVFIGIVLALLINYFLVRRLSSTAKPSDQDIFEAIGAKQNIYNFHAKYINTTRKYSPQRSSSGGGSRSSGSHGGGGGHRF